MEVILLLTACIKPNVTDYIAIPNYTERICISMLLIGISETQISR